MFDRVLHRLDATEVQRRLDIWVVAADLVELDRHGERAAIGSGLQRRGQPMLGEHGWVHALGEVAQLVVGDAKLVAQRIRA